MALLPVVGIPSDFRLPGTYLEINFNQGPSSAGIGPRHAVYCMPMLSTGTAQVNQLIQVKSESEAVTSFGAGSDLHRACRIHLKANKTNKIFCLPYADTSGGSPVKADGYINITGIATARGLLKTWVAGEYFEVSINSGDTGTIIGATLQNAVLARNWLPCSASNSSGKVTLLANHAGKSKGDGTVGVIRFRASVTSGIGITVAATGNALGIGSGAHVGVDGSTNEATNQATALATIANIRKYFIGVSTWDSTSLANLKNHIDTKSLASPGLRSVGVSAFTGSLSSVKSIALSLNEQRMALVWQPNSEHDVVELCANWLAIRQKYESTSTKTNFDSYRASDWFIQPCYATTDIPDAQDLNDAISDGVTAIATDDSGSYVVTSATTRSRDAAGLVQDNRCIETHRVAVADEVGDTIASRSAATFSGFAFKSDELNANGTVNTGQKLGPKIITPSRYAKFIAGCLDLFGPSQFGGSDLLDNINASKTSISTDKDPNNSGRLEASVDITVVDLLHQVTMRMSEVSSG